MKNYVYFTDEEVKGLDKEFVALLDQARHKASIPFLITDSLRTAQTNTDPNSVKDSSHLTGHAVDLSCHSYRELFLIIKGLAYVGLDRIGIYFNIDDMGKVLPTHIHVDNDKTKPPQVLWLTREK